MTGSAAAGSAGFGVARSRVEYLVLLGGGRGGSDADEERGMSSVVAVGDGVVCVEGWLMTMFEVCAGVVPVLVVAEVGTVVVLSSTACSCWCCCITCIVEDELLSGSSGRSSVQMWGGMILRSCLLCWWW